MDIEISERVKGITPSATLSINSKAKAFAAEGKDILNFSAGEPDFNTPEHVKQAGINAINADFTRYTNASGIPELKKAIAKKFYKDNGLLCTPENVVVSCGGKHSLFNVFQATINSGDEVIIPKPYWVSYVEQVKLAGGVPIICDTEDFQIKADLIREKVSGKTKIVTLNSPSNPSGMVVGKEELERISDLVIEKDLLLISDEVYEHLIYGDNKHISIASLNDEIGKRTVTVNAVSKTYSMTGWRIGYLCAPESVAKAMSSIQSHSTSNPTSISQKAALEALSGSRDSVEIMRTEFEKRGKIISQRLNKINGISCREPQGAFYVFPSIEETGLDSVKFCERLLEEKLVAAVPGIAFGMDTNVRFSFACSTETIEKGMDRLEEFVQNL